MVFADRRDAGRQLAAKLEHLRTDAPVVLGLPRGGVPVADEVARALGAPLDVILVRKLGVPFQPELAMGAVGEDGVRVLNEDVLRLAHIDARTLEDAEARARAELERRAVALRGARARLALGGRTAVVVDDGLATGSTARAACAVARAHGAAHVVLAVPVAPPGWESSVAGAADELVCLDTPPGFFAIGQYYDDFSQTSDDEVVRCLEEARRRGGCPATGGRDEELEVRAGVLRLGGHLTVPAGAPGVVVFAHGSGSSRHSPRNRAVARVLNDAGLGTLLFDLLTEAEEGDRSNVFDIELLADRLAGATRWLRGAGVPDVPVGWFGASTGAGAALWAAGAPGADVAAVVSRGGRPDLAGERLAGVTAPTLLIVGGHDRLVLDLNRQAQARLHCENRLAVIPGATHLFEEPGTLAAAATCARDWFLRHLPATEPGTVAGAA